MMKYPRVKAGARFGRLLTVSIVSSKPRRWFCKCECGGIAITKSCDLNSGHTKSCGCLIKEKMALVGKNNFKHGHTLMGKPRSGEHNSWRMMKSRCSNPKDVNYKYYGGRGIKVCKRWDDSFEYFLSDMGNRPKFKTLDRINVNGNYEPANCRWATSEEQARNKRNLRSR